MDTEKRHTGACKPEVGRGCAFCNCGSEPEAKLCDGCFKLHETAWLDEYPVNMPSDIVEVRFKNTRRSFYQNVNNLDLKRGDIVAVEASPGHDIGVVSLTGDLVARQMRRTGFNPYNGEYKKIYRKAKPYDIEKWQEAIALEHETMIASRQIAADMGLNMKIGDVEYQGDKIKAIFYYIADERVDFRELIKVFAERFHIRIATVTPDSLRFGEWFLLVIPHPKGPAALMREAAIPYRRRIRLTQHGDYRCSVTPVRPVRGVEAVGVDLQQSR